MSIPAFLRLLPRWAYIALAVLAVLAGFAFWHNRSVGKAVAIERYRLTAVYEAEKAKAQEVQHAQNVAASVDYQKSVVEQKIVYQDRIREITKYVQSQKSSDADCSAGDRVGAEFVRVYNNGSTDQAAN